MVKFSIYLNRHVFVMRKALAGEFPKCIVRRGTLFPRMNTYQGLTLLSLESELYDNYSGLSLSRPRLYRITAYIEVKIWSLFHHGNLSTGNKILWKRGEIRSNYSSFQQYFPYISNSGVKLGINLLNVVVRIIVFLNFANLICRGTNISNSLRESIGLRDNESRLYLYISH